MHAVADGIPSFNAISRFSVVYFITVHCTKHQREKQLHKVFRNCMQSNDSPKGFLLCTLKKTQIRNALHEVFRMQSHDSPKFYFLAVQCIPIIKLYYYLSIYDRNIFCILYIKYKREYIIHELK